MKEVGSPATLTFSTDDTKPDLKHYLLDGTEVPLVLSGRLSPGTAYSTRNVTIVHREEPHTSYTVTVHIGRSISNMPAPTWLLTTTACRTP